jgi:hypothetical protein
MQDSGRFLAEPLLQKATLWDSVRLRALIRVSLLLGLGIAVGLSWSHGDSGGQHLAVKEPSITMPLKPSGSMLRSRPLQTAKPASSLKSSTYVLSKPATTSPEAKAAWDPISTDHPGPLWALKPFRDAIGAALLASALSAGLAMPSQAIEGAPNLMQDKAGIEQVLVKSPYGADQLVATDNAVKMRTLTSLKKAAALQFNIFDGHMVNDNTVLQSLGDRNDVDAKSDRKFMERQAQGDTFEAQLRKFKERQEQGETFEASAELKSLRKEILQDILDNNKHNQV